MVTSIIARTLPITSIEMQNKIKEPGPGPVHSTGVPVSRLSQAVGEKAGHFAHGTRKTARVGGKHVHQPLRHLTADRADRLGAVARGGRSVLQIGGDVQQIPTASDSVQVSARHTAAAAAAAVSACVSKVVVVVIVIVIVIVVIVIIIVVVIVVDVVDDVDDRVEADEQEAEKPESGEAAAGGRTTGRTGASSHWLEGDL